MSDLLRVVILMLFLTCLQMGGNLTQQELIN